MVDPLTSMHTCVDDRRQQRLWVPLWHAIEQKALAPAQLQPSQDCLQTQRTWINCLDLLKTSSIHCLVCDGYTTENKAVELRDLLFGGLHPIWAHCTLPEISGTSEFRKVQTNC